MKAIEKVVMHTMNTIIVVCLALMAIMVFSNVILRFVFNSGFTMTEELARFVFLWLIFIGSVVAMKEGAHLGVDSLVSRLPRAGKIFCAVASNAIILWLCYLFFVGSWVQTVVGMGTKMPASGIPMSFHYGTGLVMSVGVGIIVLGNTWRVITGKASDADLIQVKESEDSVEEVHGEADTSAPKGK